MKSLFTLAALAALTTLSPLALAHGVKCGDLTIAHPYSVPSLGLHRSGAAYFTSIKNDGQQPDQLIGARTPVASDVEIHEMVLEQDIMKMRAVPAVQIPVGAAVSFQHGKPSGYHLMLLGLKQPLKVGDKFPVTLIFKRSGECQADVWVEEPKTQAHSH